MKMALNHFNQSYHTGLTLLIIDDSLREQKDDSGSNISPAEHFTQ